MAEPAEEDVMRLAAVLGGGRQGVYHQRIDDARRALAAGVTLPPEPDTPAEAEERYWVGDGESDNKVYERSRAHIYAETYLTLDASRIARLLNLDESVKDDVCSGLHEAYPALVEQLTFARKRGDAFQAKFEEQCQRGDDLFTGRYETMKRAIAAEAERDEARAEVERLRDKASARAVKATALALDDARAELTRDREDRDFERDLFAVRVAELEAELAETREKVNYWHDAAEVFHAQARGVDAASPTDGPLWANCCQVCGGTEAHCQMRQDVQVSRCCSGCTHERPTPDDATGRTDTATEPLTATVRRSGDLMHPFVTLPGMNVDAGDKVDVYPAGVRPAAPTVTASDIAVAVETAAIAPGRTWSTPVGGFDGLAEQGGEG